jgi:DNA polymerase III alpha subunit
MKPVTEEAFQEDIMTIVFTGAGFSFGGASLPRQ